MCSSDLYAAGNFNNAGGVPADRVARWDGASWSGLGSGTTGRVNALAVFDDGGGPALYAGGRFLGAGGWTVNRIAKWDGVRWTPLAGGGLSGEVFALAVFDDGSGPALYAGGDFLSLQAGGVPARRIAKWDGTSWSEVGGGVGGPVLALEVLVSGGRPVLHIGGEFSLVGDLAVNNLAVWNGVRWSSLGSGMDERVLAFGAFDAGGHGRPLVVAAGDFGTCFDSGDGFVAAWRNAFGMRAR